MATVGVKGLQSHNLTTVEPRPRSQSSPPIFGIVFLRTLPQHRRSRFSGSVSRLTSFGVPTLT